MQPLILQRFLGPERLEGFLDSFKESMLKKNENQ
jgi:hypothetical protein